MSEKRKPLEPVKQVFRVDAEGDTLYIDAPTIERARDILRQHMGEIPESLLTWRGPVPLPPGEEAFRSLR
jgi:hypothetical protein